MPTLRIPCLVALTAFSFVATAAAHPGHPHSPVDGFWSGLTHPLHGLDHFLAMLAVGLLGAQLGGKAIWSLPMFFLGGMSAGMLAGSGSFELPALEAGIVASVILLGILVFRAKSVAWWPLSCGVLASGLWHGFAHGAERPGTASWSSYAMGMLLATAVIHGLGVVLARGALRHRSSTQVLRWSGGLIAVGGALIAARIFG